MKLYTISPSFNTLPDLENWIADHGAVQEWISELSIREWMSEDGLEESLRSSIDEIEDLGDGIIKTNNEYYQIFSHVFTWEEFDRLMEG